VPKVGIRELKNHTSEIVREVREHGAQYIVTHQGQPVGVLLPVDETSLEAAERHIVTGGANTPTKGPAPLAPGEVLRLAQRVYADLSPGEINAVEAIALDRSHFSRSEP